MVMTPENADHMFSVMRDFRRLDIMVNIHPLLKQGFSWGNHAGIIEQARALHDHPGAALDV